MARQRLCLTFEVEHSINFPSLEKQNSVFYLGNGTNSLTEYLALGSISQIETNSSNAFEALKTFRKTIQDWSFGWLNYDLKNELEQLTSNNPKRFNNSKLVFVQPELVFKIQPNNGSIQIQCFFFPEISSKEKIQDLVTEIWQETKPSDQSALKETIEFQPSLSKEEYLKKIDQVKAHIQRGDIYEANFCQQFNAIGRINPYLAYQRLIESSPTPSAAFIKHKEFHALCASPERFLKKKGTRIITEPIKGTISRSSDITEDLALIDKLKNSEKDQTENVMIVDLARNDLSKIAMKGSVKVEELFGIYSFPQVHQMISKVVCEVEDKKDPVEIVQAMFPIASMTGVPKISALKIIEELEDFQRELYSGSIGYFTPENDFDFNVVIRSLFYNASSNKLSYAVGGAIINASDPKEEYEETLLKAKAIQSLFN